MSQADLYALLQITPSAEPEVIRAAYRALAQKHHPDAGGTQERMADLNRAWAVLGDAHARTAYDRQRAVAANRAATTVPRPASPPGKRSGDALKTVDFGRYQGWTLVQLAQQDPDYLRWLARTPAGRGFRADIEALLDGGPRFTGFMRRTAQPAR